MPIKGDSTIKVFDLLSDYSALISVGIALTNLFIVIQVFNFNKRMSQSKLSVAPSLRPSFLPRSSTLNEATTIDKRIQEHSEWAESLDITHYLFELEEFPNRIGLPLLEEGLLGIATAEELKTLSISIKNTGDLPSTNVQVKLLFRTYGTKNFYPKDSLGDKLVEREVFSEHEFVIPVAYIGANDERSFSICHLYGQFRETELILLSIKSNGFTYIKNSLLKNFFRPNSEIILNHYQMDKLSQRNLTSKDLKIIYGIETIQNDNT